MLFLTRLGQHPLSFYVFGFAFLNLEQFEPKIARSNIGTVRRIEAIQACREVHPQRPTSLSLVDRVMSSPMPEAKFGPWSGYSRPKIRPWYIW